jgi:hypothetical protein
MVSLFFSFFAFYFSLLESDVYSCDTDELRELVAGYAREGLL